MTCPNNYRLRLRVATQSGSFINIYVSYYPNNLQILVGAKTDTLIELIIKDKSYVVYFATETEEYRLETTPYFLANNNTTAYIPTDDYNPATKQYVDDNKFSGDYNDLTNVPIKLYEEELITLSENYTEFVFPTTYGLGRLNCYYYANRTSSLGLIEDQLYRIEIYNRETDELLESKDVTAVIDEYLGESLVILYIYTDLLNCIIADDSYFDASASNESITFVKQTGNSAILCIYYEDDFCNVDIKIFKKELIKLNNELLLDDVFIQNSLAIGTSKVTGSYSYAEGCESEASSYCSHAEGDSSKASNYCSHAEGSCTLASGNCSHAEGYYTIASGTNGSHAEGYYTIASGSGSHAEGWKTIAAGNSQHVQGKWNIEDSAGIYAHIVGNGSGTYHTSTGTYDRSNAHTLDWDGNAWFAGNITVGADNKELATKEYVDDLVNNSKEDLTEEDIDTMLSDIFGTIE